MTKANDALWMIHFFMYHDVHDGEYDHMEMLSMLLALCEGNPVVPGGEQTFNQLILMSHHCN